MLLLVPALTNTYFSQVHAGACRVAAEQQVGVPVLPLSAEDESAPLPLSAQAIDGILVYAMDDDRIRQTWGDVPTVMIDCAPSAGPYVVNPDAAAAGRLAAQHLLDLGHRRIGYLHPQRPAPGR